MARIGLTGGLAAGKSRLARYFDLLGASIIDQDQIARSVVAPGSVALEKIVERFGSSILVDGRLDRARVGEIVFRDASSLKTLESIIHPPTRARTFERIRDVEARDGSNSLIVVVSPLIFESGFYKELDATILILADEEIRIARARSRSGMSRADALARMRAQWLDEKKIELADYVIENNGSLEELEGAARVLFDIVRADME